MKRPLQVGDRVAVYEGNWRGTGKVSFPGPPQIPDMEYMVNVEFSDGKGRAFHSKQCRRLIKKYRRRVFVPIYENGYGYAWPTMEMAKNAGMEEVKGVLEFIEVRRK